MSKLGTLYLKLKLFFRIKEVNLFFSHTGEDILVNGVLQNKPIGFFVDVGAYDPVHYSNTHIFSVKGWRGINIDPNPESIKRFNHSRPHDININVGISDVPGELKYYQYENAVFNTFSKETMEKYGPPINETTVKVERLDKVLDGILPKGTYIDFLNVDVEGFDLRVLKSNDWKRYRPKVIAVESCTDDIDKFLARQKYRRVCNTIETKIFIDTT